MCAPPVDWAGPGLERCPQHPRRCSQPYRRAGGNGCSSGHATLLDRGPLASASDCARQVGWLKEESPGFSRGECQRRYPGGWPGDASLSRQRGSPDSADAWHGSESQLGIHPGSQYVCCYTGKGEDVLFIHGVDGSSSGANGSGINGDCKANNNWGDALSLLGDPNHQWVGNLITLSYYSGDHDCDRSMRTSQMPTDAMAISIPSLGTITKTTSISHVYLPGISGITTPSTPGPSMWWRTAWAVCCSKKPCVKYPMTEVRGFTGP